MTTDCQHRLGQIFDDYYESPLLEGAYNCSELLQGAIANQDGEDCPDDNSMVGCFSMATNTWINFVNDCELFSVAPNCVPTGVGAGQTLDQCKRPNENVGFFLTSGKASFLNSVYGYGTGFVPNVGAGWETVAAEGAAARRLLQSGEVEGGGSGLAAGCFPDFYSPQDFENWLNGVYQEPTFDDYKINPIGIIFWLLQGIGIFCMAFF
ncbi:hypothetical protein WJX84_010411 [Apatococcus fuscideae]|uniref:Uncharacterized protein n=1 Tax=Apatococcus fuscideae TaxID=2026836 RepID=A0AAW1T8I8_9CHLO